MARIKLAYIGGGSTRAPGTMASFIDQGENFAGSEIVLIDLDETRLHIVQTLAQKMAQHKGLDLTIRATTNHRQGLADCDAVLTSFRAGDFAARVLDERIPLKHGLIGQETQGAGGFFMALRTIPVMQSILADMTAVCPRALLFNYTNPINIVSEAVSHHSDIPIISLCEGPIIFPRMVARAAGLDPDQVEAVMIGLNHGSWSVQHLYQGQDMIPLVCAAYERTQVDSALNLSPFNRRLLHLTAAMEAIPASYFQYYYFQEELLAEMKASPTTRAEDILASVPDYWQHYREQAATKVPTLDPQRSRGGLHELELAIDVMDAVFNDRQEVWPVNMPNQGALPDFPDDRVVEGPGLVGRHGVTLLPQGRLPRHVVGLVHMLADYQALAAEAAWSGTRRQAVQALAGNPLCFSLAKAEAVYDELAAAQQAYLPARLLS